MHRTTFTAHCITNHLHFTIIIAMAINYDTHAHDIQPQPYSVRWTPSGTGAFHRSRFVPHTRSSHQSYYGQPHTHTHTPTHLKIPLYLAQSSAQSSDLLRLDPSRSNQPAARTTPAYPITNAPPPPPPPLCFNIAPQPYTQHTSTPCLVAAVNSHKHLRTDTQTHGRRRRGRSSAVSGSRLCDVTPVSGWCGIDGETAEMGEG